MAATTEARYCWSCGARLPAARCSVCTELAHVEWLLAQLDGWAADGTLSAEAAATLGERQRARRTELLTPPEREPEPPPPPPRPSEWQRLREAGSLAWIYALGVLFVVAGLGWLVAEVGDRSWGRWALTAILAVLSASALRAGWWLLVRLALQNGGQALLAIGVLLVPATLFAGRAALAAPGGPGFALVAWLLAALPALALAWRLRLPSQVALSNVCAVVAGAALIDLLAGGTAAPSAWYTLVLAPIAAVDVGLAWLARRSDAAGAGLARTARLAALWVLGVATIALVATGGDLFLAGYDPRRLLAPLLLAGAIVALAHETDRPELIGLAAAVWYLAGAMLGAAGLGVSGQTVAVLGLLAAAMASRPRPLFARWYAATSLVATVLLLGPRLPELTAGRPDVPTAVGAWLVAALYLALAAVWAEPRALAAALGVATIATLFTVRALGLPPTWFAPALALLGGVALAAGTAAGERPWGRTVTRLAVIPLATAGALGLARMGPDAGPLSAAGLLVATGVAALAAKQAAEPRLRYLAGALLWVTALVATWWLRLAGAPVDAATGTALVALVLTGWSLANDEGYRPLEVVGAVLALGVTLVGLARLVAEPASLRLAGSLAVAALALGLPVVPLLAARSHLGAWRATEARTAAAVIALAGAASAAGAVAHLGYALGPALVALAAAAASLRVGEPWATALAGAAVVTVSATTVAAAAATPSLLNVLALTLGQAAAALAVGRIAWATVPPTIAWVVVWMTWLGPEVAPHAVAFGLLVVVAALAHLGVARRSDEAAVTALVVLRPAPNLLARAWLPGHELLGLSIYLTVIVAAAVVWRGRERAARGCLVLAGLCAAGSAMEAMLEVPWRDGLAVLAWDTLLAAGVAAVGVAPAWPAVVLANATGVHALLHVGRPSTEVLFGLRLAALSFANVALAAPLRAARRPLLIAGAITGACAFLLMMPPERATVGGLLLLSGAAFVAAWLLRTWALDDLGFGLAWLAGAIVLVDAANHGRVELAPYRSLDLYAVPVGLYLLATVERRTEHPGPVRWTAVAMVLGSLVVSSFTGSSILHDAALFVAVFATVPYSLERRDAVTRYEAFAAFVLWVVVQAWRLRAGLGRLVLIGLLIGLGSVAIAVALRQERRGHDEEAPAPTAAGE